MKIIESPTEEEKELKTINVTDKTGNLIALKNVTDENDLMVVNKSGITIRISVADLRQMGRATQGVRIIKLREKDSIAAVAKVPVVSNEEEELSDGQTESTDNI